MDPKNASEGYILGQLMAVLERTQQAALDNVNASVVDRYFGAASATPKTVFVRLMKNARHHVRKARENEKGGGMAFLLDRMIDELASRFIPKTDRTFPAPNSFPSFLDLDQQGLFVLGYHHMRKWLWMTTDEHIAWEQAHPDAPRAYLWKTGKVKETEESKPALF